MRSGRPSPPSAPCSLSSRPSALEYSALETTGGGGQDATNVQRSNLRDIDEVDLNDAAVDNDERRKYAR